jgi:hypothetical protein
MYKPWQQSLEKKQTCGTRYLNTKHDLILSPLIFPDLQIDLFPHSAQKILRNGEVKINKSEFS